MQKNAVKVVMLAGLFLSLIFSAAGESRGIRVTRDLSHASGKLGQYRALVIGIDAYADEKIPDLKTAVNDATAMAAVLEKKYGFATTLLLNGRATKQAIFNALRQLAASSHDDDSILIYYAGHGEQDKLYDDGWWIPADAVAGNPLTYLDNSQVQKAMRNMKARHVLLIADSCYSGTLFGQARAMPPLITEKYYLDLYNEKSRWGMTSGNKTPVTDRGIGKNSIFAHQLLNVLSKNEKPFISTQEIYTRIAPVVSNNSEQTPMCRPIRNTGDMGGEFVFVASGTTAEMTPAAPEVKNGKLYVHTSPSGARIRILNIRPRFYQGMDLGPGKYHVEASAAGYDTRKVWIPLTAGERKQVDIQLDKAKVSPQNRTAAAADDFWKASALAKKMTNSLGMAFVYIPPGTFMMGSPAEEPERQADEPLHPVTLSQGFYMQTTEVTVAQWNMLMGSNPSRHKGCGEGCPVEKVSYNDAQAFIARLNRKEKTDKYGLPTEAQWEYACRAGSGTPFAYGPCLSTAQANFNGEKQFGQCTTGTYQKKTIPVGRLAPNAWGLYDMHGNVYEWCQDWYGNYPRGAAINPAGPAAGRKRVVRGGNWGSYPENCRSARRMANAPDKKSMFGGFRLVRKP